ncbi:MAG: histidine kinase [Parcubacteria group bacterium Gr01-1014_48]|nr:MAG: histidine kinase [Parcubacteria group bacterium Greene0416_14]TSC73874.1 MAG: histidine kinase [Parcubacteria group bacterium Gr01-1014_48]TSD01571.1 MAG: histidine kinase [Parcubacteria group bacterium Greene1014_15]TSD08129.1 MAG: histidine kinase [Parcubacteria group bacterium Greene0714_4]
MYTLIKITDSPLRTRFLLYFIILTTAPVLVLGAVAISLIDASHRRDVSALELQLINQKIEETEKFLERTLGVLEVVVGYDQKVDIELTQQNFFLDGLLSENDAFEEVSFASVDSAAYGKETAKKSKLYKNPELFTVALLPKFIEAKEGKTYISEVYYTLKGPFVTMSAPVRNRNGIIVEVLSAEVSLQEVVQSINAGSIGARGGIVLADNNGRLIAHREPIFASGAKIGNIFSIKRVLAGEKVDALQPQDRYESLFYKEPVVGAGKKMPDLGWAFLAEWPLSDADAVINGVRNQVLILTLVSILGVLFFAPLVASRLTKPINALKSGAEEIEQGHFDKEVSIATKDELGELGLAFNRMAKGLKRLEELKNEFVYIAAHELRAPVTAIKGYVSLLVEGRAKGGVTLEAAEFIDRIDRANEGLVHLVNDLLEVARSDAGKIEIAVQPVSLGAVVKDVVATMRILAEQKKITFQVQGEIADLHVLADPDKLKEILTNLISNAIKYTLGAGALAIKYELDQGMVITHIEDTGVGISFEAQKKLFEKFYRVKAAGTEEVNGTGLGLFIVKQLVQKMGGKIWFVSQEGKGSTFSFSLPRVS